MNTFIRCAAWNIRLSMVLCRLHIFGWFFHHQKNSHHAFPAFELIWIRLLVVQSVATGYCLVKRLSKVRRYRYQSRKTSLKMKRTEPTSQWQNSSWTKQDREHNRRRECWIKSVILVFLVSLWCVSMHRRI